MLHGFDDELIIAGEVKDGPAGARVAELPEVLAAEGHQVVLGDDSEQVPEVPERSGGVHFKPEGKYHHFNELQNV